MLRKIILAMLVGYITQLQAITLEETITLSKINNHKTKSIDQLVNAKDAEAKQAMTLENPYLGFEAENFGGDLGGLNKAEYTATISFTLPSSGNRKRHAAAINAAGDVIRQTATLTEVELAQQVKKIFVEALAIQLRLKNAKEQKQLVLHTIVDSKRRIDAGIGSEQELLQAEHKLIKIEMNIEQQSLEMKQIQTLLSLYAGTTITSIDGDLLDWVNKDLDQSFSKSHPLLQELSAEEQSLDAEYELVKNSWKPDVTMFAGVRHDGNDDASSFLVGFETPLPVLNRNTHGSKAINHRRLAIEAQRRQLEKDMLVLWTTAMAEYNNATNQITKIQTKLLPKIKQVEESTYEGYIAGIYRLTDLLLVQREKTELEATIIDVALEAANALCIIEFLQEERQN
jgi:outer membrane protein TolC